MVYGAVLANIGVEEASRSERPRLGVAKTLVWYRIGKNPHNRGQSRVCKETSVLMASGKDTTRGAGADEALDVCRGIQFDRERDSQRRLSTGQPLAAAAATRHRTRHQCVDGVPRVQGIAVARAGDRQQAARFPRNRRRDAECRTCASHEQCRDRPDRQSSGHRRIPELPRTHARAIAARSALSAIAGVPAAAGAVMGARRRRPLDGSAWLYAAARSRGARTA